MRYDLVFEGGGAKGMVFAGAYDEFVQRGNTFGRLLGTSAGAITAVLLAAGYSPEEVSGALNEREDDKPVFAGFMGEPEPFTKLEVRASAVRALLGDIRIKMIPASWEDRLDDSLAEALAGNPQSRHFFAFVERGGWYAAEHFVEWLKRKLDSGESAGVPRAFSGFTLQQFYAATGVDLSVVASDTTDGRMLTLNHRTTPDCPVVWAVRMSMSIPLVWNEVIWLKEWGTYLGRDMTGHAIVDGGMLSNFPIELFLSDAPQVTRLMGPKTDDPVQGWLIDESLPVPQLAARGILVDIDIRPGELRTVQRLRRLVDTMTGAHDKMVIEEFEQLVVRLPAKGYGTTEFDMSETRRNSLVAAGRQAMSDYLDSRLLAAAPRGIDPDQARVRRLADRTALRILEQE